MGIASKIKSHGGTPGLHAFVAAASKLDLSDEPRNTLTFKMFIHD